MSEEITRDTLNPQQVEREAHQAQAHRDELVERITRAIREDGRVEPLHGLYLTRTSAPIGPIYSVADPAFCVIAQGSKELLLGEDCYRYDPTYYLLTTVDLPLVGQIVEASPEQPYLGLRLELDPTLISSAHGVPGSAVVEAKRVGGGEGHLGDEQFGSFDEAWAVSLKIHFVTRLGGN